VISSVLAEEAEFAEQRLPVNTKDCGHSIIIVLIILQHPLEVVPYNILKGAPSTNP
jgi:hypothetical protein